MTGTTLFTEANPDKGTKTGSAWHYIFGNSLQKLTPIRGRKLVTLLLNLLPNAKFTEANPDKGTKTQGMALSP